MSAPEPGRSPQHYGTIVVVGGGCYGTYYVRQLRRAVQAGAIVCGRLLVVDRDAACPPARDGDAGRRLRGRLVFHCTHRPYGVGMIDVGEVLAADEILRRAGETRPVDALVGTVSHCHGAVSRLVIDAPATVGQEQLTR